VRSNQIPSTANLEVRLEQGKFRKDIRLLIITSKTRGMTIVSGCDP